jgi:hypothetical protein
MADVLTPIDMKQIGGKFEHSWKISRYRITHCIQTSALHGFASIQAGFRNCTAISNLPLETGRERTTSQIYDCAGCPLLAMSRRQFCPTARLSRSKNDTPLNDISRVSTSCLELALGPSRIVMVALLCKGLRISRRRSVPPGNVTGGFLGEPGIPFMLSLVGGGCVRFR